MLFRSVKGWLAKALSVSRGPQWVCDKCQQIHQTWQPVCENCESFDTLSWIVPPTQDVPSPTGVQMLPLIIGEPARARTEDPVEDGDLIVDVEPLDESDAPPRP